MSPARSAPLRLQAFWELTIDFHKASTANETEEANERDQGRQVRADPRCAARLELQASGPRSDCKVLIGAGVRIFRDERFSLHPVTVENDGAEQL